MTWQMSIDYCKDLGGHLLEIDSSEEDLGITVIVTNLVERIKQWIKPWKNNVKISYNK